MLNEKTRSVITIRAIAKEPYSPSSYTLFSFIIMDFGNEQRAKSRRDTGLSREL